MANLIVAKGAVPKVTAKKTTTYEYNEIYDIRETDYVYNDSTETGEGEGRFRPPNWNGGFPRPVPHADGSYYNPNNDSNEAYSWYLIKDTYTDPLGNTYEIVTGIKLARSASDVGIVSNTPSSAGATPPHESPGHTRIGTIYLYIDHRGMPLDPPINSVYYVDRFSEQVHDGFCVVGDAIQHIEYKWRPAAVMKDYHYDEQGIEVIDGILIEPYSGYGENTSIAPSRFPTIHNEDYPPEIKSHTITVSEVVT